MDSASHSLRYRPRAYPAVVISSLDRLVWKPAPYHEYVASAIPHDFNSTRIYQLLVQGHLLKGRLARRCVMSCVGKMQSCRADSDDGGRKQEVHTPSVHAKFKHLRRLPNLFLPSSTNTRRMKATQSASWTGTRLPCHCSNPFYACGPSVCIKASTSSPTDAY